MQQHKINFSKHTKTLTLWAASVTSFTKLSQCSLLYGDKSLINTPISKLDIVVGVMEMGNIVLRARIEPTSLAFRACVLTITPHWLLISPLYPSQSIYTGPCLSGQCNLLHSPARIVSLLKLTIT